MAAEALARAGHSVLLAEAKPSLARKFLMAGKSGLNLTRAEPLDAFLSHYHPDWVRPYIRAFGPDRVQDFARDLGQELFTGSTGRVFPRVMKASPMLRGWIARLGSLGVEIRTRWRWTGFEGESFRFDTPDGPQVISPRVTVLALGGASWPRLGSDAAWVPWLAAKGVTIAPFKPANMGLLADWSAHMAPHFGAAIKGAALHTDAGVTRGEFVLSKRGLEGGGIYTISAHLREGSPLHIDLCPDLTEAEIASRLARQPAKLSVANRIKRALGLDAAKLALLNEWGRPLPAAPNALAARIKALPARHAGPRPLAEAISSAGGVSHAALTDDLELRALPSVFACGEMLDWEAPTGGYLLTGCFATGLHAGRAAAARLTSA